MLMDFRWVVWLAPRRTTEPPLSCSGATPTGGVLARKHGLFNWPRWVRTHWQISAQLVGRRALQRREAAVIRKATAK